MEFCGKIFLLCSTTRHLTPAQMYYRARRMARRQWWKVGDRRAPQGSDCGVAAHRPLYSGFASELQSDTAFAGRFLGSLFGQARFLAKDLEFDVRGNHLLKNLRALLWAGLGFEGAEPEHWLDTALTVLEAEIAEQVLPDG